MCEDMARVEAPCRDPPVLPPVDSAFTSVNEQAVFENHAADEFSKKANCISIHSRKFGYALPTFDANKEHVT